MAPSTPGQIPDDEAWHRTIILPRDILDNRPSGNNDVEWETELAHRIWGCELIQEAGILLRWVESSTQYAEEMLMSSDNKQSTVEPCGTCRVTCSFHYPYFFSSVDSALSSVVLASSLHPHVYKHYRNYITQICTFFLL